MKQGHNIFSKYLATICGLLVLPSLFGLYPINSADAAVAQRGRATASRTPVARKSVTTTQKELIKELEPEPETPTEPIKVETEPLKIDLSDMADSLTNVVSKLGNEDEHMMAKKIEIAKQKEKYRQAEQELNDKITNATIPDTADKCYTALNTCIMEKCGTDYSKCANDSTAQFDAKMTACRGKSECSGREYELMAAEILADRDANRIIGTYETIVNAGNEYKDCIVGKCGPTFQSCLGTTDGNNAIAKCKSIATKYESYDNGLAARMMTVFSNLRTDAEEKIALDEQSLYDLRDQMRAHCEQMGAGFDDRSLSCVFSIDFIAGEDSTIFASKKAMAGSTFICEPDWFGIDITTFRENVYRHIRSQSAATAGMLGAGVGIAGGAISSGAIGRAIETTKAKNATKAAKQEYSETYGEVAAQAEDQAKEKQAKTEQKAERKETQAKKQAEEKCEMAPGAKKMTRDKSGACVPEQCQKGYVYAFYGNDITCKKLDCKDGQIQNQRGDACIDDCTKSDLNKQDGAAGVTYSEKQRKCIITRCKVGYTLSDDQLSCIKKAPKERNKPKK